MRGQGPTDRTPPAGITKRVASLARPVAQILRCAAPGVYTFTDSGPGSGLDLSARMFAPCLLGRPGTGRQDAVLTSLRLAGLRYSSACHSIPVTQVFKKVPLNSGLLIRGFGVQVPGGAPGGLHVSAGWLFTFGPCRTAVTAAGQDQGRCIPAFPRKRPAQLRAGSPTCGLAALNLWSELKQDRIRAGQSQT